MTFQGDLMNLRILQTKTWTAYTSKQQKKLKKKRLDISVPNMAACVRIKSRKNILFTPSLSELSGSLKR